VARVFVHQDHAVEVGLNFQSYASRTTMPLDALFGGGIEQVTISRGDPNCALSGSREGVDVPQLLELAP
jgi:hypothetical protein